MTLNFSVHQDLRRGLILDLRERDPQRRLLRESSSLYFISKLCGWALDVWGVSAPPHGRLAATIFIVLSACFNFFLL